MDVELEFIGAGAVTSVGLTAAQSCAAIRAGLRRFTPVEAQLLEHEEPRVGARVSADPRLRADDTQWLLSLAARSVAQCMRRKWAPSTALFWLIPEQLRAHPLSQLDDAELLERLSTMLGYGFAPGSRIMRGGAASFVEALGRGAAQLAAGEAKRCLIGGADSLLRPSELDRLARDGRLISAHQSQGLVPGEGGAFALFSPAKTASDQGPGVTVRGVGLGYEENTVQGTAYSSGEAFTSALMAALDDAGVPEADIDFVAGNFNGERYDAWETSHANLRGYRTRRERLPKLWPASSTGEMGVAGGPMTLIASAIAMLGDYADGPTAAVQLRSDGELRGVAILAQREPPEGEGDPDQAS